MSFFFFRDGGFWPLLATMHLLVEGEANFGVPANFDDSKLCFIRSRRNNGLAFVYVSLKTRNTTKFFFLIYGKSSLLLLC